jgi:hypothetical protein
MATVQYVAVPRGLVAKGDESQHKWQDYDLSRSDCIALAAPSAQFYRPYCVRYSKYLQYYCCCYYLLSTGKLNWGLLHVTCVRRRPVMASAASA